MYECTIKVAFDFLLSFLFLIVISPFFIAVIIILFLFNGERVFFLQQRPGKNGKIFRLIKFKTMNERKDKDGNLLPDSERLTVLGKMLRKLSIDELPQLINVLKGDMSLIGPRPLLIEYLSLYSEEQKRRHEVKPGITGWAQVNGRNTITWSDKFKYDIYYVDNISFQLDLKILFLTIFKILKSEGINSETSATMERFTGNL